MSLYCRPCPPRPTANPLTRLFCLRAAASRAQRRARRACNYWMHMQSLMTTAVLRARTAYATRCAYAAEAATYRYKDAAFDAQIEAQRAGLAVLSRHA